MSPFFIIAGAPAINGTVVVLRSHIMIITIIINKFDK